MTITCKDSGTGFVLQGQQGKFIFGSRVAASKQIVRSISQAMYGSAAVHNLQLKAILLAHNPQPTPINLIPSEGVIQYLSTASCNPIQAEGFRQSTDFK